MELPQPRPLGTEGKKPTHNFLSLYSNSSYSDPRATQGNGLKTHDFLQPLERVEKNSGAGERIVDRAKVEKSSPSSSSSPSVEHILPGGIGTYTISHISNISQRGPTPKTEQSLSTGVRASSADRGDETSNVNCISNSVAGGAFAFWEESNMKEKGKKVKEILEGHVTREPSEKLGQWSSERPLQSPPPPPPSSFLHCSSFNNSLSSSKQSQKSQSFMEMIKSGRGLPEEDDDDDEEYANSSKRSSSSQKDGKRGDQKANTPRSKHSATEQRRRSKINDRFQILRELIPQNDQKRDKASFLLEVIEYIQYLQEKVTRYESSYQGWNQEPVKLNQEPAKLTPWRNGHAPNETTIENSQPLKSVPSPSLTFGKFDDNILPNPTSLDPSVSTSTTFKTIDPHHEVPRVGFTPAPQLKEDNPTAHHQSQLWPNRSCTEGPSTSGTMNEQEELTIEGGTINLAGVYSQGLLNNLTQALQSSGVDLSHASVSVQVDIGKRATKRLNSVEYGAKEWNPSGRGMAHSRVQSSGEDSDQGRKRARIE